ncbi:MAG: von Willebrand factor type A domain-containing protein [Kofleriaceae bacterium]
MRKTLASLLLCSTLLAPACSKKSSEAENAGAYIHAASPTDTLGKKATGAVDALAVGVGSAASDPGAEKAANAQVAYDKVAMNQPVAAEEGGANAFKDYGQNPWIDASKDNLSTFAADVDTASYTLARRMLNENTLPPKAAIRVEEFVNYFAYSLPNPPGDSPFAVLMEAAPSPLSPGRHILRVGVSTKAKTAQERKPANLVFLVDVSGSMNGPDRIELAKKSLRILTANLIDGDTVSLVTYAGSTRVVLEPTNDKAKILSALDDLHSGGSTGMASGIDLAYQQAAKGLRPGKVSRVIILSDGDANVGAHTHEELLKIIAGRVKEGVTLSTIGFGIGNYKDTTMEQLANKGNGNNFYVDSIDAARKVFQEQIGSTLEVVAKDAKFQVDFDPKMVSRYRLVGYENRDIADDSFRDDKVDAGEIGAGHQVTAMYEIELTTAGKQSNAPLGGIRIRHKAPTAEKATEAAFPMIGGVAASFANSSVDFRFAFATAAFADVLRGSTESEHWSLVDIRDMAKRAAGDDKDRREMVSLIERTMQLTGRTAAR